MFLLLYTFDGATDMKHAKEFAEIQRIREAINTENNTVAFHTSELGIIRTKQDQFNQMNSIKSIYVDFYPHAQQRLDALHKDVYQYLIDNGTLAVQRIESAKIRLQRLQKELYEVRNKLAKDSGCKLHEVKELEKELVGVK